jgi:hypothetical protein
VYLLYAGEADALESANLAHAEILDVAERGWKAIVRSDHGRLRRHHGSGQHGTREAILRESDKSRQSFNTSSSAYILRRKRRMIQGQLCNGGKKDAT